MNPTTSILALLFAASCVQVNAQEQQKIIAMAMVSVFPAGDTTDYGVPIIDSTTIFTAMMSVILDNTDSIYQLHIKLGSTLHGSQYLSADFDYGVAGTFGSTSYSQTGNSIEIGLGDHEGMIKYFSEVQIEKTDQTFEDVITFSNN